jgi:hypothetical protein
MAITKIGTMSDPPGTEDWTTLMSHVQGYSRQVGSGSYVVNDTVIAEGSYIYHGGILYKVNDEDYTIEGTFTDGEFNYIQLYDSGTGYLTATWITDVSDYSWNYIYSEMLNDDEYGLLPYVNEDGAVYRLDKNIIIYTSDQNLNTTNDATFNSLTTTDTVNAGGYISSTNGYKLSNWEAVTPARGDTVFSWVENLEDGNYLAAGEFQYDGEKCIIQYFRKMDTYVSIYYVTTNESSTNYAKFLRFEDGETDDLCTHLYMYW